MNVADLIVGEARRAPKQRTDELRLMIDQALHVDGREIGRDRVGLKRLAVEVQDDSRNGPKSPDFIVQGTARWEVSDTLKGLDRRSPDDQASA